MTYPVSYPGPSQVEVSFNTTISAGPFTIGYRKGNANIATVPALPNNILLGQRGAALSINVPFTYPEYTSFFLAM